MPGGDRTGPMGAGPRTGRSAGYCAGFDGPGYLNPGYGGGFGGGFRGAGRGGAPWGGGRGRVWGGGRGRGFFRRLGWFAPPIGASYPSSPPSQSETLSASGEIEALKSQAEYFRGALEAIEKRLEELSKEIKQGE